MDMTTLHQKIETRNLHKMGNPNEEEYAFNNANWGKNVFEQKESEESSNQPFSNDPSAYDPFQGISPMGTVPSPTLNKPERELVQNNKFSEDRMQHINYANGFPNNMRNIQCKYYFL
jgi:hypothetical protein